MVEESDCTADFFTTYPDTSTKWCPKCKTTHFCVVFKRENPLLNNVFDLWMEKILSNYGKELND